MFVKTQTLALITLSAPYDSKLTAMAGWQTRQTLALDFGLNIRS